MSLRKFDGSVGPLGVWNELKEFLFITSRAGFSTEESCAESVISTPASTTVEDGDDGLVKRDAYLINDRVSCSRVTCATKIIFFVCSWCVYI